MERKRCSVLQSQLESESSLEQKRWDLVSLCERYSLGLVFLFERLVLSSY